MSATCAAPWWGWALLGGLAVVGAVWLLAEVAGRVWRWLR